MKIGLRGGHSPYCKGAISLRDEQECVRRLSYEVKKILEKHGHTVIDCNNNANTEHGELSEGAYKANSNNVDYFISIHMNCCNSQAHGVEAWTYNEYSRANNIAKRLVDNYARIGYYNRGVKYNPRYYEMRNIKAPNIIFETLFCDNKNDVDLWAKTSWEQHASAIANAIDPNISYEPCYDNNPTPAKNISINSRVRVTGDRYATGQKIPQWVKKETYTVMQLKSDRFLLKEIMSWVYKKDVYLV